ncbi:hypothetical protein B0H19DRAFT_1070797 [Mycena capillaripes]|nr:hypothetical protein B0H19DRAFT_1070797 [Mycena capillaripes]
MTTVAWKKEGSSTGEQTPATCLAQPGNIPREATWQTRGRNGNGKGKEHKKRNGKRKQQKSDHSAERMRTVHDPRQQADTSVSNGAISTRPDMRDGSRRPQLTGVACNSCAPSGQGADQQNTGDYTSPAPPRTAPQRLRPEAVKTAASRRCERAAEFSGGFTAWGCG